MADYNQKRGSRKIKILKKEIDKIIIGRQKKEEELEVKKKNLVEKLVIKILEELKECIQKRERNWIYLLQLGGGSYPKRLIEIQNCSLNYIDQIEVWGETQILLQSLGIVVKKEIYRKKDEEIIDGWRIYPKLNKID